MRPAMHAVFLTTFEANLHAPFELCQLALPDMIERLELEEPVKQKILHDNAKRLLRGTRFER